jgi:hypothetical protein
MERFLHQEEERQLGEAMKNSGGGHP